MTEGIYSFLENWIIECVDILTEDKMKIYIGNRDRHGCCTVMVNGKRLKERQDLCNYSPDGFEWGYAGSGPAQLALAILADCFEDAEFAILNHQIFKLAVIAKLSRDIRWELTEEQVRSGFKLLLS